MNDISSFVTGSNSVSPKVVRDDKVHVNSKNSDIFPKVSLHAYKDASEIFCSESQRSFGSRVGHYQDNGSDSNSMVQL